MKNLIQHFKDISKLKKDLQEYTSDNWKSVARVSWGGYYVGHINIRNGVFVPEELIREAIRLYYGEEILKQYNRAN